jgi:plastocyanin
MEKKRYVIALAIIAMLGAGCGDDDDSAASDDSTTTTAAAPTGPQTYNVIVDGPSTLNAENYALGLYFPKTLAVRPGDTVNFENRGVSDPHTITFGVKADRSDSPALIIDRGTGNPAVFGPCFTAGPPKADMTSCAASPSGPPEFAATGFWNSGAHMATTHPVDAAPKTVTL